MERASISRNLKIVIPVCPKFRITTWKKFHKICTQEHPARAPTHHVYANWIQPHANTCGAAGAHLWLTRLTHSLHVSTLVNGSAQLDRLRPLVSAQVSSKPGWIGLKPKSKRIGPVQNDLDFWVGSVNVLSRFESSKF